MPVGQSSHLGAFSYLAFGQEQTLNTGVTSTAGLDFMSSSIRTVQETRILEQISTHRTMAQSIQQGKVVQGDIEYYFKPEQTACAFLLQNAFGATVTSATSTGETAGGAGFTHTFLIGDNADKYKSLSVNHRKGASSGAFIFEYTGGRVNSMAFSAELDDALKASNSLIFMDSTKTSNDVSSALTISSSEVLSFVNGRFSVENSFASLTSTSFWHVQAFNLTINNNLKSDNNARRIGSAVLSDLPIGIQNYELSATIKFDTTTAYDAMLAATTLYAEFEFLGSTMAGSIIRRGIKFQFAKLKITDAGDPEIGGPDEILTSEVSFAVLRDDSSASGYAIRALLTNLVSAYS